MWRKKVNWCVLKRHKSRCQLFSDPGLRKYALFLLTARAKNYLPPNKGEPL